MSNRVCKCIESLQGLLVNSAMTLHHSSAGQWDLAEPGLRRAMKRLEKLEECLGKRLDATRKLISEADKSIKAKEKVLLPYYLVASLSSAISETCEE